MQADHHLDPLAQLLFRAGRGDAGAFERLHASLFPGVRDYVASLDGSVGHHDREDLLQEIFLHLWQGASRFKGAASVKTFVLAIARNTLRKHQSRQRRPVNRCVSDLGEITGQYVPAEPRSLDELDHNKLCLLLPRAMAKLTEEQRQAVELDQILGLSRTEAVRLAKCSPDQFASRLYRAMTSLRRILSDMHKSVLSQRTRA